MAEKTTTVAGDAATNDMEGLNRTLSFVLDVKERLDNDSKEKYEKFLAAFDKYQKAAGADASAATKSDSLAQMKTEVKALLVGHDDLITEFDEITK